MTRRVASAALSAVLLVLAVVTGLSATGASASAPSTTTVAAAHTSPVTSGSDRRPGSALTHLAADRQAPGWSPLDPPLATVPETGWAPGEFATPDLVRVAGLSIVTAARAHHQGRAPPALSAI